MLIRTLNLERKGLRAFREDASDTEEPSMTFPKRFCDKYPHLPGANQVADESQDVMYMGGSSERRKNQSQRGKKQSCFEKLMSITGNSQNNFRNSDPKTEWESMTPKEQEERVEQLWIKARRYNNKLRF